MMAGRFKEYNWEDIQQLIYKDIGLDTDQDRRGFGQMWYVGGFQPPEHEKDTCVRVNRYDKTYSERLEDHAGDKT